MNSRPARSVVVTWTWFRSRCTCQVSLQRLMRRHPLPSTDLWPQLFSDVSCIALWISSEKILTRLYSVLHWFHKRLEANVKKPRENRCFQTVIAFSFSSFDNSKKCTVLLKIAARLITVSTSVNKEMWVKLSPSTGSLGLLPPLQRYYEVLRLPAARFAALRFLRLAIPSLRPLFVSPGPGRGAVDQSGVGRRYLQPPGSMEEAGSPKFPEVPL